MAKNNVSAGMPIDLSTLPPKCNHCAIGKQMHSPVPKVREGSKATDVTVLALTPMFAFTNALRVLLVTFSKCRFLGHVTVSTDYIKRTAFLVTVVARIPLRQSYFDYD